MPQLRPLIARVPDVTGGAEREDALLGAALLLVATRAAEGRIELPFVERLLQRLGLHHLGMQLRAGSDRIDAAREALRIGVHQQLEAITRRDLIAVADHVAEFPFGVDVQQREGRLRRIEGLEREVQHHPGVLADRVEHHRVAELGRDLADDADGFRLEALQVLKHLRHHIRPPAAPGSGPRSL